MSFTIDRPARLSQTLRRPIVISGVLFAVMLALRGWVQWVGPIPGDRFAISHYSAGDPGLPHWIIDLYVMLARPWFVVLTLLVGVGFLWRTVGVRASVGLVLVELDIVWNALLKAIFGATPLWTQSHAGGVNYPSGHTSYVVAVFGYLAWIGIRRRWTWWVAVCCVIIVGMGPERVLSGTHLVSDVIGGYLLGLAWLILMVAWVLGGPALRRSDLTRS